MRAVELKSEWIHSEEKINSQKNAAESNYRARNTL